MSDSRPSVMLPTIPIKIHFCILWNKEVAYQIQYYLCLPDSTTLRLTRWHSLRPYSQRGAIRSHMCTEDSNQ